MQAGLKRRLFLVVRIAAISALVGALYGYAAGSVLRGALTGFLIAASIAGFEVFIVSRPVGAGLRRLGFVPLIAAKTAIYLVLIMAAQVAAAFAVPSGYAGVRLDADLAAATLFSLAIAAAMTFVIQVDRMLGQGELARFVRGRYHHPRVEERIFLLLDLVGSTGIAERLGGERFLALLNDAYDDVAGAILEQRGEIHKYVGDEMIVTWTPARGLAGARCLRCVFAIEDALARRATYYRQHYGMMPSFRYVLHLGTVVSGELGSLKQEIAYIGDAINVAARLVDAGRSLDRPRLASQALLDRLTLPAAFRATPLEPLALRGRQAPLAVAALDRVDTAPAPAPG